MLAGSYVNTNKSLVLVLHLVFVSQPGPGVHVVVMRGVRWSQCWGLAGAVQLQY